MSGFSDYLSNFQSAAATSSIPATEPTSGGMYNTVGSGIWGNGSIADYNTAMATMKNAGVMYGDNSQSTGTTNTSTPTTGSTTSTPSTGSTTSTAGSSSSASDSSTSSDGSGRSIFGFSLEDLVFIVLGILLIGAGIFSFKSTSTVLETVRGAAERGAALAA